MKEKMRSKVVLQAVAQVPNHSLVWKAGLFFCQGLKEIRIARSESSKVSYFSKRYPVSKDFMGSLPKNSGQGKKLCGVQNPVWGNFCYERVKRRRVQSGRTPMDVRDLYDLADGGRSITAHSSDIAIVYQADNPVT